MAQHDDKERLFDGSSDSSGEDDDQQEEAHLRVNEAYAKRFEHNSRRAELHKLQEKHPEVAARLQARDLEGGDTESSSSEEEDEGELSPETEHEWTQALLKIKRKDPSIYDAQTRLFHETATSDESLSDKEGEASDVDEAVAAQHKKEKKSKKKKLLREILYEQAVAEGGAAEDPDANETDFERKKRLRSDEHTTNDTLAYDKEQQSLRDAFVAKGIDADAGSSGEEEEGSDDEHGGLKVRKRVAKTAAPTIAATAAEDLNAYFSTQDNKQDHGSAFLQQYLQRRLWAQDGDDAGESAAVDTTGGDGFGVFRNQRDGGAHGMHEEVGNEENEFLDRADRFEKSYNFRSEEPQGAQISTYPRRIEGLARQEESKRKRQRESKRTREEERGQQRQEEVKRLKNLKKREVGDALSQLADVSGKGAPSRSLLQKLLESDFDPSQWDEHMSAAFDEEYYAEAEREDEVTAAASGVLKEVNAWVDADVQADDDGVTFDKVHKKVTGKDTGGLLPETDYAGGEGVLGGPQGGVIDKDDDEQEGGEGKVDAGAAHSEEDEEPEEDVEMEGDVDEDDAAEQKAASRDKVHDLLRDYYKLDHEDEVGGVKTRFRYRQVAPIRDGLSTEEILSLPDRDLNAIIGLRKLAPYREDVTVVRPNYKALAEARQKLVDEGLFIDKSKGKWGIAAKRKGGEGSTGGRSSLGVKNAGVAKKAGAWAAANSAGSGAGGKVAKDNKGRKEKELKHVDTAEGMREEGGAAGKFGKKKRPGPALRRAMKEASAAKEGSGGGVHDVAAEAVHEPVEKVQKEKKQRSGELEASVKDSSGRDETEAKATSGKNRISGNKEGRKTLHVMTEEEKAKARAASYAGVALPSAAVRHDAGKGVKSKVYGSQEKKVESVGKGEGLDQAGVVSELSKAARKNMKRRMKRESRRVGTQGDVAQA